MKVFSDAAMAAMIAGTAGVSGAVLIACDPPVAVWGGYGPLFLDGDDEPYLGIGDRGLAQNASMSIGGSAQGVSLTLSGVQPEIVALFDATEVMRAPVTITRLLFDSTKTILLDSKVFKRGRIDQVNVTAARGAESTIEALCEDAARGLHGRAGGRRRTDADQRLVEATDGGFRHVSYAAQKTLYWGGQPPATAGQSLYGSVFTSLIQAKMQNEISG